MRRAQQLEQLLRHGAVRRQRHVAAHGAEHAARRRGELLVVERRVVAFAFASGVGVGFGERDRVDGGREAAAAVAPPRATAAGRAERRRVLEAIEPEPADAHEAQPLEQRGRGRRGVVAVAQQRRRARERLVERRAQHHVLERRCRHGARL